MGTKRNLPQRRCSGSSRGTFTHSLSLYCICCVFLRTYVTSVCGHVLTFTLWRDNRALLLSFLFPYCVTLDKNEHIKHVFVRGVLFCPSQPHTDVLISPVDINMRLISYIKGALWSSPTGSMFLSLHHHDPSVLSSHSYFHVQYYIILPAL